jgi:hypothetical protein
MQQIYLIVIKYPTLLMLNKRKLENYQQPLFPTYAKTTTTYAQQNLKTKSYNLMPKPNQLTQING